MLAEDKDTLRRDRNALESALRQAGAIFRGGAVKCPFHDDKHPSGGIYQDEKGIWRFTCHTATCGFGGDVYDVQARNENRKPEDILREIREELTESKPKSRVYPNLAALKSAHGATDAYSYTHPKTGAVELVVLRCPTIDGGKTFLQASPCEGGFHLKSAKKPWPIYNRKRLDSRESPLVIVEGEKCVHVLHDIGVVATTSPGGAANADKADWSPLAGKTVYLWPDNDEAGQKYMAAVASILEKLDPAPTIRLIDISDFGLPPKGDVVEYLQTYGGETKQSKRDSIACALEMSTSSGAASGVGKIIEDTIAGRRFAAPWPYKILSNLTKALLPQTVTCICGDPGDGKSFMVLESGVFWYSNGIKCAIKMLEEDQSYHLYRALALVSGDSRIVNDDWVKENPEESRRIYRAHEKFLNEFGRCIYTAPDEMQTLDQLAEWVEKVAAEKARVIVIDPITMAETSSKPWIDDIRFLAKAKATVRKYDASLVLITHPRKGNRTGNPSLHDMAGGAAYQRFSQTVMWVRKHEPRRLAKCHSQHGPCETKVNRSILLGKTRNGRGGGLEIGFDFSGGMFRFAEQGVVTKWIKQKNADPNDSEES